MARPLRIQYPGAFYHVMNRGISHAPIFYDKSGDRSLFRQTLADAVRLWKIRIHAFSLMDNHYHLLVETPLANLSRAMQHIDGVYTQRFNRLHRRDGPLIRGRFKSILVQQGEYFLELVRYIHLNGVRALRFPSARVDSDSSHPDYIRPTQAAPWLQTKLVLSYFSDNIRAFDQFVHQGVSLELDSILSKRRWPAILGTREFVEAMRVRFLHSAARTKDRPQVGELQLIRTLEPNKVIEEIVEMYQDHYQGHPAEGVNAEGRWAIMVALRRYAHLTYQEIATLFGEISYDAVEKFIKRNDFSRNSLFREIEARLERLMSNVEI